MFRMLIGVDGRTGGRDAIALAAAFASAGGTELALAHVVPYGLLASRAHSDSALARAHDLLARESLRCPEPAAQHVIIEGSVASGLVVLGRRHATDLIVVGATHRRGVARLVLGDDAAGLVDAAPCAVAVAPPNRDRSRHPWRVGVVVDETEAAQRAFAFAERLVAVTGSDLIPTRDPDAAGTFDVVVVAVHIGQLPRLPGRRRSPVALADSADRPVVVVPTHARAPLEWLQPA